MDFTKIKLLGITLLISSVSFGGFANEVSTENIDKNKADSIQFEAYLAKAEGNPDSADYYFKKALPLAKEAYQILKHSRMRCWYLFDLRELDSVISVLSKSMIEGDSLEYQSANYITEMAKCHILLRTVHVAEGEYHKAIEEGHTTIQLFKKAEAANDPLYSTTTLNLSIDYWRIAQYMDALKMLDITTKHLSKYPDEADLLGSYITYGLIYEDLNNLPLAKEYYNLVFSLIGDDIDRHGRNYMANCNNIAIVFYQEGKYDSALHYYAKSLEILESKRIEKKYHHYIPRYIPYILGNIGNVQYQLKNYDQSIHYYLEAIKSIEENLGELHPTLEIVCGSLANIYIKTNEFDKAKATIEKVMKIAKRNNQNLARTFNYYGDLSLQKEQFDLAISYYDSAIKHNNYVFIDSVKVYDYPDLVIRSFKGKSEAIATIDAELTHVEKLFDETKELIQFLHSKTDDLTIYQDINTTLESYYSLFHEKYIETNEMKWAEYLWEISEIAKASKLKKQLRDEYLIKYSIPDSLNTQISNLKDSIGIKLREIKPGTVDSSLFILNRRFDYLIGQIEKDFPKYHALKKYKSEMRLAEKMDMLASSDMTLNFFEGEENVYLLKINNHSVSSILANKDSITTRIEELNTSIFNHSAESITVASTKIREMLQVSAEDLANISHLSIQPDGIIWNLNFASLTNNSNGPLTYLGNEVTILYGYYSQVSSISSNQTFSNNVLAFSYNAQNDNNLLKSYQTFRNFDTSLPGTSLEISSIAKLWDGDYYYANEANESNFKELSDNYGILHLAVHAYQDKAFPENSYLKFSNMDSLNDGILYAYELYNLRLNAELAVLSACNSGLGKVVVGEGMQSLAQAFAYAGVKSTVASRWEVPDVSAPLIMNYFYKGLKEGMSKSQALKYAQNEFLTKDADNITSSPFYWAGFYIIGDDSPITTKNKIPMIFWIGFLIVSILTIFFYSKRSINSRASS